MSVILTFWVTKIDGIFNFLASCLCLVSFTIFRVLDCPSLRSGLIVCLTWRRQTMNYGDELLIFMETQAPLRWRLGGLDLCSQN
jgi:hypothetical protein